ncbi:MAG: hypothetical protein PHW82_17555 [Bacteroidales bacterium]|nr:hypothetical protein [Bacteroidales bacterium]
MKASINILFTCLLLCINTSCTTTKCETTNVAESAAASIDSANESKPYHDSNCELSKDTEESNSSEAEIANSTMNDIANAILATCAYCLFEGLLLAAQIGLEALLCSL